MKFNTWFNRKKENTCSPSGSRFAPVRKLRVTEVGEMVLDTVSQYDLYAEIQSYKDSCDLSTILRRFGDPDGASVIKNGVPLTVGKEVMYGDFSTMPKTYAEVLQRVIDARNLFESLDSSVKSSFNNSAEQFIASFGDERWKSLFGTKDSSGNSNGVSESVSASSEASEKVGE